MKKINLHLIAVCLSFAGMVAFNFQYNSETFIFFGFAENKEAEIRLEHPVAIEKIYAIAGTKVREGDLLMEVTRSGLDQTQSGLHHEIAKLSSEHKIWEENIKGTIKNLEAQKAAKKAEIQSQIAQLESELEINKSLVKGLKSIETSKRKKEKSPSQIRIDGLKKDLRLAVRPLAAQIYKLKKELSASDNPLKIQIEQLKGEVGFVKKEEEQLKIFAPSDGIVGSFSCKEGEQFPAFSTLVTFYQENPTQVKAYVLESLILNVKTGDEVIVSSSVQSTAQCRGKVVGMGSRIIEIPERLRKMPDFKTYGREVLIEIPAENSFLQKEKVTIKMLANQGGIYNSMLLAFKGE